MAKAEPIRDTRQVRAIMDALENDQTKIGKRRYLLFMTGIFTGRRVSDIVRLRVRDVLRGDEWEEKVNQIRLYSGAKYKAADEAPAGSVCAGATGTRLRRRRPGSGRKSGFRGN